MRFRAADGSDVVAWFVSWQLSYIGAEWHGNLKVEQEPNEYELLPMELGDVADSALKKKTLRMVRHCYSTKFQINVLQSLVH